MQGYSHLLPEPWSLNVLRRHIRVHRLIPSLGEPHAGGGPPASSSAPTIGHVVPAVAPTAGAEGSRADGGAWRAVLAGTALGAAARLAQRAAVLVAADGHLSRAAGTALVFAALFGAVLLVMPPALRYAHGQAGRNRLDDWRVPQGRLRPPTL